MRSGCIDEEFIAMPTTSSAELCGNVFSNQLEACVWHVEQLAEDCQSACLLDLAALWRSRVFVLETLGAAVGAAAGAPGPLLMSRVDAHASAGLTAALGQMGCGGRVRGRDDLMAAISAGLTGAQILLDNPCNKPRSLINLAKRHSVAMTTFDSEAEANRLAELWPDVTALLLVRADTVGDQDDASLGASPNAIPGILLAAKRCGLKVAGVAIVDCCNRPGDLEAARLAINIGRLVGYDMSLLDVGQIGDHSGVDSVAKATARQRQLVDAGKPVRLICDPTDALLSRSIVVATRVVAMQPVGEIGQECNDWHCTLGDSVFGAFAGWHLRVGSDGQRSAPELLAVAPSKDYYSTMMSEDAGDRHRDGTAGRLWLHGSTDSPDDRLGSLLFDDANDSEFPRCQVGDWLFWSGVGADNSRMGRRANGLAEPTFLCFLQSGREAQPPAPFNRTVGSRGGRSVAVARRTRHSSSCCHYSGDVAPAGVSANVAVAANDQVVGAADREICCSVMLS